MRPSPAENIISVVYTFEMHNADHWNPSQQMRFQCPTNGCEFGPKATLKNIAKAKILDAHQKLSDKLLVRSYQLRNDLK
jgi:hypothetical protein